MSLRTIRIPQSKRAPAALASLFFAFLLALSCGGGQKADAPTTKAAEEKVDSRATDMHLHFDDINAIQLALISGNLNTAQSLAKQVRAGFGGQAPTGWEPFIERSVASAEMLQVASDLNMAARIASTMAMTCGDCHRQHNVVVVDHVAVPPPHESDRLSDFMVQHRWAADRMWEGLIGPSEEAWLAGSQVLAETNLTMNDVGERLILTPEIEAMLLQIRKDAAAAGSASSTTERQELYGSFLAGCAGCHRDLMNQRD